MYKYIFWDCDNTLVANGKIHWEKHVNVLARHGITLDPSYFDKFYHNNGEQNWEMLVNDYNFQVPCAEYLREIDTWYHARIAEAPLRPGVAEALEKFHTSGVHQCVVTNARGASVRPMLQSKNLLRYFDFVLSKEDYTERKPHPMPYLSAYTKMQEIVGAPIDKSTCLAIEDDPLGVASAAAAGLHVLHRRRNEDETPEAVAQASLYHGDEFLEFLFGKNR